MYGTDLCEALRSEVTQITAFRSIAQLASSTSLTNLAVSPSSFGNCEDGCGKSFLQLILLGCCSTGFTATTTPTSLEPTPTSPPDILSCLSDVSNAQRVGTTWPRYIEAFLICGASRFPCVILNTRRRTNTGAETDENGTGKAITAKSSLDSSGPLPCGTPTEQHAIWTV